MPCVWTNDQSPSVVKLKYLKWFIKNLVQNLFKKYVALFFEIIRNIFCVNIFNTIKYWNCKKYFCIKIINEKYGILKWSEIFIFV
jgi:hypothetical protein